LNTPLLQHSIHHGVPPAARALIWKVFFSSRGRGVDLPTHYPWIGDSTRVTSILISKDGSNDERVTAATLVIKEETLPDVGTVGLVGLVCVDDAFRGSGLSHQLLSAATDLGKEKPYDGLVLWTNKPNVYVKHGFTVDSHDRYGTVRKRAATGRVGLLCHGLAGITVEDRSSQGVPAFAQSVMAFSNHTASITVLRTQQGCTLIEWTGNWDAIFQLIDRALPDEWNLNAPEDSGIYVELINRGYSSNLQMSSQRMVSNLSGKDFSNFPYISLLNRI
jgi:GNAT superfamily N-acetyltransferase